LTKGPDPIHQFEVVRLINISIGRLDVSFTNVSLFMMLTVIISTIFLLMTSRSRGIVPTRMQSISEIAYEFIASTLRKSTGIQGMHFFPFVFSLFIFILVANCIGLIPYCYTVTSQITITFVLAVLVMLTVIFYGFFRHRTRFFRIFVPSDVPIFILPLITTIEVISFLSRPISLSIRLFANMLAGHITLKVFAGFIVSLVSLGPLGIGSAILPLIMTIAITALEFLVAFLQAYVFTVLTCMYLNDAIHLDH